MKEKYGLEGELKRISEEKDVAIAHINNLNRQYENAQETVSDMGYDHIKLQSCIYDLTSDLVVSSESANEIKTNWNTTSIF